MAWIKNVIVLIKLLIKFRDSVLPNLKKLNEQISELGRDVDNLLETVSRLSEEKQSLKYDIAEIKGRQSGVEKTLILQNQLIQILLNLMRDSLNRKNQKDKS